MKKLVALVASFAVALSTAYASPKTQNIVEIAAGNPEFSTLVELVKTAGLAETLSGPGPFTLFAPTNAAFSKVDKKTLESLKSDKVKLASVLKYHVVPGRVAAKDVVSLTSAKSVEGSSIAIKAEGATVKVDEATVTKTDIAGSNGIIHVIDTVILPGN